MAAELFKTEPNDNGTKEILNQVAQLLKEIRFGSVEIILHEGRVVQIERKEKLRFNNK
jgi:hypothetical protein